MNNSPKINYQRELDKIISEIQKLNKKPTLLVHSCCAPCSSYVLEYLCEYFDITVLYYNPNISPIEEYEYRKEEQKRLISEKFGTSLVKFLDCDYDNELYEEVVKGLENEPEGGRRCSVCFSLRLDKTAKIAKENNFDYFVTTLTISPLKNADLLNKIGNKIGEKYGVSFLPSDFKKKNGYKRSIELSKEYNLYRQNFCGCRFSKKEEI